MTGVSSRLHLAVGDDEFLIDRAVAAAVSAARASTPDAAGAPLVRMRAGEVTAAELAEHLSPSLFSEDRIVVLDAAGEAGREPAALIVDVAKDLPDGVHLIVAHSGGGRAKSMVAALTKAGAEVVDCARITRPSERVAFVRNEFRSHKVRAADEVCEQLIDAVGSDLRDLAAAAGQLAADTGGRVDSRAVATYYSGRAEVSGFEVADRAVTGQAAAAVEALRWAVGSGTAHVLVADALAEAVHTIARVRAVGSMNQYAAASELGIPPFRVDKARRQARGWTAVSVARALQIVAALNGAVKGQAADADYALEKAVLDVAGLASARR